MIQENEDTIQGQAAEAAETPVQEAAEQPAAESEVEIIDEQGELQAQIDKLTAELENQKK